LINLIQSDPNRVIKSILVEQGIKVVHDLELEHYPKILEYTPFELSTAEFDRQNQVQWLMPLKYQELDIAQYVLDLCKIQEEKQRVGEELMLFFGRGMENLLKYLVYLVDTMRNNQIVWGVGRGSSVASYVLYLIGVHKIDSMYYGLEIGEFLKPL
jgi:DNA polymerase III alpha subunit